MPPGPEPMPPVHTSVPGDGGCSSPVNTRSKNNRPDRKTSTSGSAGTGASSGHGCARACLSRAESARAAQLVRGTLLSSGHAAPLRTGLDGRRGAAVKLAILGGGGFRVPLVHGALLADGGVTELLLHDVDAGRLAAIERVLTEQAAGARNPPRGRATTDLAAALAHV